MRYTCKILLSIVIYIATIPYSYCTGHDNDSTDINITLVTDESEAVLAIINKLNSNENVTQEDWKKLFSSEGYQRVKEREGFGRHPLTDDNFKAFVQSDSVIMRADAYTKMLNERTHTDFYALAKRTLQYLPSGTSLRLKVCIVIKPDINSYPYTLGDREKGIIVYITPDQNQKYFENTVKHELFHAGNSNICSRKHEYNYFNQLKGGKREAVMTSYTLFEGVAVLAAAGSWNIHPLESGTKEEIAQWDKYVLNFNTDLKKIEKFLFDILNNRLKEDEINRIDSVLRGPRGPWYVDGWKMAATIERIYGRDKVIECICDPRRFMKVYNMAAKVYKKSSNEHLELWSESLIEALDN